MPTLSAHVLLGRMISRRLFSAGILCLVSCGSSNAEIVEESGCIVSQGAPDPNEGLLPGLRTPDFKQDYENGLIILVGQLADFFLLDIAFGLYDDSAEFPNAHVSEKALLRGIGGRAASDGTVAVGRNLINQLRKDFHEFGAAVTAVCAHECGHILQYKYQEIFAKLVALSKIDGSLVRAELHADFISGYFAAFRKREQPQYPAVAQAIAQYRYGDRRCEPANHGTPRQRADSVYAGFLSGESGGIAPKQLVLQAFEYVEKVKLD